MQLPFLLASTTRIVDAATGETMHLDLDDPAIERFAQHCIALGWESNDLELYYSDIIDEQPWEVEWHVQSIDTDDTCFEVRAEAYTSVAEKTRRASRLQPPEYKNHDVTLQAIVRVGFAAEPQLAPEVDQMTVEQVDGPYLEDPHYHEDV